MNSAKSRLLACTAIATALGATMGVALAAAPDSPFAAAQTRSINTAQTVAQAELTPTQIEEQKKKTEEEAKKKAAPPAAKPAAPPPPPPAAKPATPPPPPPAAKPATPPPPAARPVAPPPPPPPAAKPATPPQPPAVHPVAPPPPPAVQQRPAAPSASPPPAVQGTPPAPPAGEHDRRPGMPGDAQRNGGPRGPGAPGGTGPQGRPGTPPPAVAAPPAAQAPAVAPAGKAPAAVPAAQAPAVAPATQAPAAQAPAAVPAAQTPAAATAPAPSAARTLNAATIAAPPPPPTVVRNSNEFIRTGNAAPNPGMADVRKQRQETRDGDRIIIREGDRTIVHNDNRTIIQHNESSRFAVGASAIRTETRGDQLVTVVERPGDVRITSYSDRDGRLMRRVRRDRDGRETVLIDNMFAGAVAGLFIAALQPPVVRMPRETYIVDGYRADRRELYDVFIAPPIDRLEQRYTLDQVRYNAPLREYMRRVDLDVNFDTGSWQLTPQQIDRLAAVADGLNRAISRNPREIFLIEGHTDTVGNNDDNLSLSDRRAEAVAVALTERFQVPSENLVTQGYGEEYPKEQVDGPSRINRRVAIRRITPLIDQTAQR